MIRRTVDQDRYCSTLVTWI